MNKKGKIEGLLFIAGIFMGMFILGIFLMAEVIITGDYCIFKKQPEQTIQEQCVEWDEEETMELIQKGYAKEGDIKAVLSIESGRRVECIESDDPYYIGFCFIYKNVTSKTCIRYSSDIQEIKKCECVEWQTHEEYCHRPDWCQSAWHCSGENPEYKKELEDYANCLRDYDSKSELVISEKGHRICPLYNCTANWQEIK